MKDKKKSYHNEALIELFKDYLDLPIKVRKAIRFNEYCSLIRTIALHRRINEK